MSIDCQGSNQGVSCDPNKVDLLVFQRMVFIYNALETGWSVKKKGGCYVFKKRHENDKEVYLDSYLSKFIDDNFEHR